MRSILKNPRHFSPPYDYVQDTTVYGLEKYLGCDVHSIRKWCIVGGYLGHEIPSILRRYPSVSIDVFECSKRYSAKLSDRFSDTGRVTVINKAVSDRNGMMEFHETNLRGSGSLLPVGPLARNSYGAEQAEAFQVDAITLDDFYGSDDPDVLWIDVQGAEMMVLKGAQRTIDHTRAVFTEVSIRHDLYIDGAVFGDVDDFLKGRGFQLVLLGTDWNLTGNALYVRAESGVV